MSRGCHSELPPVVTYKASALTDPQSGYWTVFHSEWAARVAVWLLWDAYDRYKLWYVPQFLRRDIRALRLAAVLGTLSNEKELHSLLDLIDNIDWTSAEYAHTSPDGENLENPGEPVPGDFVWFDAWAKERVPRHEALERRHRRPGMPANQICGYVAAGVPGLTDVGSAARDALAIPSYPTLSVNHPSGGVSPNPTQMTAIDIARRGREVRAWLVECGLNVADLPADGAALTSWGRTHLATTRLTVCHWCEEGLCEECWAAYSARRIQPLGSRSEPGAPVETTGTAEVIMVPSGDEGSPSSPHTATF